MFRHLFRVRLLPLMSLPLLINDKAHCFFFNKHNPNSMKDRVFSQL